MRFTTFTCFVPLARDAAAASFGSYFFNSFATDAPASLVPGLSQGHAVAALAKLVCGFQSGRAGANHQHVAVRPFWCYLFWMPALTPLFPHRRVLGAAYRGRNIVPSGTDIAPNTLADVVGSTFLNFIWQERISDGGPRGANHVH